LSDNNAQPRASQAWTSHSAEVAAVKTLAMADG